MNNDHTRPPLLDRFVMGSAFGVGLVLNIVASCAVFVSTWWYLYERFGFILGGLLGWFPAGILALVVYVVGIALAPLVGLVVLGLAVYVLYRLVSHGGA